MLKEVKLKQLKVGDLIWVRWYDHSESRAPISNRKADYDTPIYVIGIYLGTSGQRKEVALIAKEKLPLGYWQTDNILIEGIDKIWLVKPSFLNEVCPGALKKTRKFVTAEPHYSKRVKALSICTV
jgi:hypothetical protein